ncbi:YeeE/YedE [Paraburkholderia ginsengiterrae]|uniref:YeeE/YedE n=1 Tax=Paraburkholderia ginsengiterrae TaxID=1462993 RepID=A0A1A9N4W5_9BURK|nr:YeeE/YedE family protein [Paraburkholderia ginsengiterrae]OAJ57482.1 YeeE/YedE [Paraburkholderia ginsengiterrae]OAJ58226.1 YeeE/YedE [Paraburkholderia ginsengiterrae]
MNIDLAHFHPGAAVAGGLLIGFAAALLVMVSGRIAGISGIVGGLLYSASRDRAWRVAFLLGLVAAPWVFRLVAPLPAITIESSQPVLVTAGLLVGIGTRYASGCTSGHGVCGLSRGSLRSLAATITFMAVGFGTVFVTRHLLGL